VVRRLALIGKRGLAPFSIALALPSPALAVSHKIAIGDFRWSSPVVNVDLGEHVTWYWVGPDTEHSVTGISANDSALDSDPRRTVPAHRAGDRFTLAFNQPGTYEFQCKLHAIVRGQVVVSAVRGNPALDPDPVPPLAVDLVAPDFGQVRLARTTFGSRGTRLRFSLDERATIDAELYRLRRGGRKYAGYMLWRGHVGYDDVPFRARTHAGHRLRPGRYVATVRATDAAHNDSPARRLRFTVR
jgi:plastocyanin